MIPKQDWQAVTERGGIKEDREYFEKLDARAGKEAGG